MVTAAKQLVEEKEAELKEYKPKDPCLHDFEEFKKTKEFVEWHKEYLASEGSMFGKRIFLAICQILILIFLWIEIVYGERG